MGFFSDLLAGGGWGGPSVPALAGGMKQANAQQAFFEGALETPSMAGYAIQEAEARLQDALMRGDSDGVTRAMQEIGALSSVYDNYLSGGSSGGGGGGYGGGGGGGGFVDPYAATAALADVLGVASQLGATRADVAAKVFDAALEMAPLTVKRDYLPGFEPGGMLNNMVGSFFQPYDAKPYAYGEVDLPDPNSVMTAFDEAYDEALTLLQGTMPAAGATGAVGGGGAGGGGSAGGGGGGSGGGGGGGIPDPKSKPESMPHMGPEDIEGRTYTPPVTDAPAAAPAGQGKIPHASDMLGDFGGKIVSRIPSQPGRNIDPTHTGLPDINLPDVNLPPGVSLDPRDWDDGWKSIFG